MRIDTDQQQQQIEIIEFEDVIIQTEPIKFKYLAKNIPANTPIEEFVTNVEGVMALSIGEVERVDNTTLSFSSIDNIFDILQESNLKIKKQKITFEAIKKNKDNNKITTKSAKGRIKLSGLNVNSIDKDLIINIFNISLDVKVESIEVCQDYFVLSLSEEHCQLALKEGSITIQRIKVNISRVYDTNLLLVIQEPLLEHDFIVSVLNHNFGLNLNGIGSNNTDNIKVDVNKCLAFISLNHLSVNEVATILDDIRKSQYTLVLKRKKALLIPYYGNSIQIKSINPFNPTTFHNHIISILNSSSTSEVDINNDIQFFFFDDNKSAIINFKDKQFKDLLLSKKSIPITIDINNIQQPKIISNINNDIQLNLQSNHIYSYQSVNEQQQQQLVNIQPETTNQKTTTTTTNNHPKNKYKKNKQPAQQVQPSQQRDSVEGKNTIVSNWKVYLYPIPEINFSLISNRLRSIVPDVGIFKEVNHHLEIPLATKEMKDELLRHKMILIQSFRKKNDKKEDKKKLYKNYITWVFEDHIQQKRIVSLGIPISKTIHDNIYNKRRDLLNKVRSDYSVKISPVAKKNDFQLQFSGPSAESVNGAIEVMKDMISNIKEKMIETPTISPHHRELYYKTLNDRCYKNKTVTNRGGEKKNGSTVIIQTTLVGPQEDIDSFANFLEDLQMETFELDPTSQITTTIKSMMVPELINKEFGLNIKLDPNGMSVYVCGSQENVSNFSVWLESNLTFKSDKTEDLSMTNGEMFFYKRLLNKDISNSGIRVIMKKGSIFLSGELKKVQVASTKIKEMKSQLETYKFLKNFPESTVKELDHLKDYFTKEDMVFCRHKVIKMKKSAKTTPQELDDSDEETFYMEKTINILLTFVGFKQNWSSIMEKISAIEEKQEGRAQEISNLTIEEYNHLKNNFNPDTHKGIQFNNPKRTVIINRLWKDDNNILINQVILSLTQFQKKNLLNKY